jgi:hypothetical protein
MVLFKDCQYKLKLYEGIRCLLLIKLNSLNTRFNESELFDLINPKLKENKEFYLICVDVIEKLEKNHSDYNLVKARRFIVNLVLGNSFQKLGIIKYYNGLVALEDKKINSSYKIDESVLLYFNNQLYEKLFKIAYRFIDTLGNDDFSVSITYKTSDKLYPYLESKRMENLKRDLVAWLEYNNLDYFFHIYEVEAKICIYFRLY